MKQPTFSFSGPVDTIYITKRVISEISSEKTGASTTDEMFDLIKRQFTISCKNGRRTKQENIFVIQTKNNKDQSGEYLFETHPEDLSDEIFSVIHDLVHEVGLDCNNVDIEKHTMGFLEFIFSFYTKEAEEDKDNIVEVFNTVSAKDLGYSQKDLN